MRKLTATPCLTIAVLLGSEVRGSDLPPCPSDQTKRYHNCFGTHTWVNGDKYVGEFRDGKRNGHGTFTYAKGGKYVGEWKDNKENGQVNFKGTYKNVEKNGRWVTYGQSGTVYKKYTGNYKDDKKISD